MPYADPRAYTDRLNAPFSLRAWTREYKIETMSNITRARRPPAANTFMRLVRSYKGVIELDY
jgi:hypothetical protein